MVPRSSGPQEHGGDRQPRRMVLLSVLLVVAGCIAVAADAVLIGIVVILISCANLLLWSAIWIGSRRTHQPAETGRAPGSDIPMVVIAAAVLMGLGSLALFVFALTAWDTTGLATRVLYSQPVALAASAIGTALFGGGGVLLLVRRVRGRPPR